MESFKGIKEFLKRSFATTVSAALVISCSARSINPEHSSEYQRNAVESFAYGWGSLTSGATAPLSCGAYYAIYPFRNLSGQGAIGIYFIPFTALFGVIMGTFRAVPMVGVGIADIATFGFTDYSAEYLYSYNGFGQWCACATSKCVKPKEESAPDTEDVSDNSDSKPTR